MDFPEEYSDIARDEFNHKYSNSWVLINSKAYFVEILNKKTLITDINNIPLVNIKTIEPFVPKVGLYLINNDTLIYCHKYNKKQWLKSFSIGKNYNLSTLDGNFSYKIRDFIESTYLGELAVFNNHIYFHWLQVGYITSDLKIEPLTKNNIFKKEIEELWLKTKQPFPIIWEEQNHQKTIGTTKKTPSSKTITITWDEIQPTF